MLKLPKKKPPKIDYIFQRISKMWSQYQKKFAGLALLSTFGLVRMKGFPSVTQIYQRRLKQSWKNAKHFDCMILLWKTGKNQRLTKQLLHKNKSLRKNKNFNIYLPAHDVFFHFPKPPQLKNEIIACYLQVPFANSTNWFPFDSIP